MARTKYEFTEEWRRLRNLVYPFTNELKLTKTGYGDYKTVPRSKVEDTLKELIELGLIRVVNKQ